MTKCEERGDAPWPSLRPRVLMRHDPACLTRPASGGDRQPIDGGVFSVDINGVLIRGHFVRIDRPRFLEIAWGEAGNAAMPPGHAAARHARSAWRDDPRRARAHRPRPDRGWQARYRLAALHRPARHRRARRRSGAGSVEDRASASANLLVKPRAQTCTPPAQLCTCSNGTSGCFTTSQQCFNFCAGP